MSENVCPDLLSHLTELFEASFGPVDGKRLLHVHAPGRSEISGNHTDHEGGHVIAAALDVAVDGLAWTHWTSARTRRAPPPASSAAWPTRSLPQGQRLPASTSP